MKINEYKSPQGREILQDVCLVGDTNLPNPIPTPPPGTHHIPSVPERFFFFPIKFPIVLRSRKTYHFKTWEVTRLTRLLMLQCSLQRCPLILLTTFYQRLKKKKRLKVLLLVERYGESLWRKLIPLISCT